MGKNAKRSLTFLQNGSKMGMSYCCNSETMLKVMAWVTVSCVGLFFFKDKY